MVVHSNGPCLQVQKEPREQESRDGPSKASFSPSSLKIPPTPPALKSSKQTSTRRNYTVTATLTVGGPAASTFPASTSNSPVPSSRSMMDSGESDRAGNAQSDPGAQEFRGDIKVSAALPSRSALEKIADLSVFDVDGNSIPFKSLYWSDSDDSKRVLIIFIRHFFCGNCQEYLRTLAAAIPPSALPSDTSIRIVGCGSHSLIPSYIEQTKCPYPIFADPSKKLYNLLGMTKTLSLGNKDPDYIHQTIVSGMMKSIAQGLKRIGSGDVMQGGDFRQVGGEFLFEVVGRGTRWSEAKPGNKALNKLEVTWCHRMKNTRDHAELPVLTKVLGLEQAEGEERRRRSEPSWRNSGLARSLSNKRQSLSWSRTRRRSRSAGRKPSAAASHKIITVDEESKIDDAHPALFTNGRIPETGVKG